MPPAHQASPTAPAATPEAMPAAPSLAAPEDTTGHETTGIAVQPLQVLWQGPDWLAHGRYGRSDHLLLWTTRGQGRGYLGGLMRGIGVHNAIYVPAGMPFGIEPGVQLSGQLLRIPAALATDLPSTLLHLRIRDTFAQSELTGLLEQLARETANARPHAARAALAWTSLIGVWMMRQSGDETPPNAAARLVQAFAERVEATHAEGLPMADHAAALGVTPTHLTRCCNTLAGAPASRLLALRVHLAAARALTETDRPAKDIAASLGFASAAYFTRAFQHNSGLTPSAFRKLYKK